MKNLILTLVAVFPMFAVAGADLSASIIPPASHMVYETERYQVKVSNVGNRTARSVNVDIQLPETNTTDIVLMGSATVLTNGCSLNGTKIQCYFGKLRKGKLKTIDFDLTLPYAVAPLIINASVSMPSESNTTNNQASLAANLGTFSTAISTPANVTNRHCTGSAGVLTSFYECELYEAHGAITSHYIILNADGSITIPGQGAFTGSWTQPNTDSLEFSYSTNGSIVVEFSGKGVGGSCFEGRSEFPLNPSYDSMYEVCL